MNELEEELLKNDFILEVFPERHFRVYVKNFTKFFGIIEDDFLELKVIKDSINILPTQISYSLLSSLDEKVFINKEETLEKFNKYIMGDSPETLKGVKYCFVHLLKFKSRK